MAEDIGRAEVQFANHAEVFDSVRILPDSILRVANLHQKRLPFDKYERPGAYGVKEICASGEHDVQYFPPGIWVSVERLDESGSLLSELSTRHGDLQLDRVRRVYHTIGDRLTSREAVAAAREELQAMGVTDRDLVDRHCERLTYHGTTGFISLPLPKYALIRRFRAKRRWFGYGKGQPGKRQGVIFSFVVSPEPEAVQNDAADNAQFTGLSVVKGSS